MTHASPVWVTLVLAAGCTIGEFRVRRDATADSAELPSRADALEDLGVDRAESSESDRPDVDPEDRGPPADALLDASADVRECPTGTTRCGLECLDTMRDPLHCGACGAACAAANATAACVMGRCAVGTCEVGFADCDGEAANGCEASTTSNPLHCGSCGRACDATGGTAVCQSGACAIRCAAGRADCDGAAANGCEVDVQSSAAHCGGCNRVCALPNATASCVGGACALTCRVGFGNCDGSSANGCEVNLASDNNHCGACGFACVGGTMCTSGVCARTCAAGQAVCAGRCVELATDASHCGACGSVCAPRPNASAICMSAVCRVACSPGFGDCDGTPANGCETGLTTSPSNCGGCGRLCAVPNATSVCVSGACTLGACSAGFASCDGLASNGCETDIRSSVSHCGGCGRRCAFADAVAVCVGGACAIAACNAGRGDCDGVRANGCEADLVGDLRHCGRCEAACTGACGSGVCTPRSDCGSAGMPCCVGSVVCSSGLACVSARCVPCGELAQPCCMGVTSCRQGTCNSVTRVCA